MLATRIARCAALGALAVLAACPKRTKPAASDTAGAQPPAPVGTPLAGVAAQKIIVLPACFIRGDTIGWGAQLGGTREYLTRIDDELAFATGERGVKDTWVFPAALQRSARRSAGIAPDPYAVAAEPLRPPIPKREREQLPDPLASQLRALVALNDARYALVPIEVRFERAAAGTGRAVLHLVLVDARTSQVRWEVDVRSDPATAPLPAVPASLAAHVADLIGPAR